MTPTGPIIQQSLGRTAANRTYQDLLQNSADESMFEHYATSQIAVVSITGESAPIGAPGIHLQATPSPDGRYILVRTIRRPFSYIVPVGAFPSVIEVWDARGQLVKRLAELPLRDDVGTSFDAVPKGPRNAAWRADIAATVVWEEALDDGDPSKPATKRDRLYSLAAPFSGAPLVLLDVDTRIGGVHWVRGDLALVEEDWFKTRRTKTWAINPTNPATPPRLVFDRLAEDRYAHPGTFATTAGAFGRSVVLTSRDGRIAYLTGSGASVKGDFPFLDQIDLATGAKKRVWQSAEPHYEEVIAVLDSEARRILTRRESVKEAPNVFLRDIGQRRFVQLTRFPDPAPQFAGTEPQLITYRRADGVQLSAKLYLPAGYDRSKGPLPFLFWAYPAEFKTAAAAAQVIGSPYRFVRPAAASHLFALTQGYGVLDNPTMPIVGEGDREPNDSYVEQLVASATAAIDKVVALGVADRQRIAIGGHSYGAFMAANLLAHSDLFRAGIARSGAYNRTLTPFGFQAEERPFWKARETYAAMSPFYYADRIKEPILLIHGEADDNSGTFPIQSERMYAALKGNGGVVRYVVLPSEAHGYRARESVGHTLWEMINWLDKHVKSASSR
jgi:dipeptidyl aminopeptidase/acylaminoacyl peptidase